MNLSWQHLLAFIVAVSVLVTVHEFGHYWVARRLGFKVLRFSVGFGKALYTHVGGADRTEYVIAAIPLGGYVKMLDEREGPVADADIHRSFTRKPHWQRILVLLAGPAFNILFAILLLTAMFMINGVTEVKPVVGDILAESPAARAGLHRGLEIVALDGKPVAGQRDIVFGLLDAMSDTGRVVLRTREESGVERDATIDVTDATQRRQLTEPDLLFRGLGFSFWQPPVPPVLGVVEAGGPAALAGLRSGDEVVSVNGERVADFQSLRALIETHAGDSVALVYRRAGTEASVRVQVAAEEVNGKRVGRVRAGPAASGRYPDSMLTQIDLGPLAALQRGTAEAWNMTALQARIFWRMLLGQVSLKNLSGPLTIAEFAGDSATAGASAFAGFLVLISLSLGFLNLLPIPILDGGQIVYQLLEWAKGSPLSERVQALGQQVGVALLVLLMGVALFNDIARQFG
ncbi:MAG TPA: RIP metalloprotease RseP [Steroidobacteraceae bacterium]|nr:RIP metalloprotease RseP [Steroidobacteraceae bacterium]